MTVIRVLGIDPGLNKTGWGIVDIDGNRLKHIANGVVKTNVKDEIAKRLAILYNGLYEVVKAYQPDDAAIEQTFVNQDANSALKLGHARGVCMLVPAQFGLNVSEYAPNAVKKAVVGAGHADKVQIQHMVKMLLPNIHIENADSADALAIAICHSYQANTKRIIALAELK